MKGGRVCIVGAGPAGIATAYAISRAGLTFDWYEAGSQVGGLWRYGNDSGSSVYASLITNTSQVKMTWFGYPMPNRKNDYLTHRQVLDYLTAFMGYAGLESKVIGRTRITSIEVLDQGRFRVLGQKWCGERIDETYSAVVLATGYQSTPKWPKMPGSFRGELMHACEYRTPEAFAGKRVIVVGFGASGADIACDAAEVAKSVALSTRTGGYLLPRYSGGIPRDEKELVWVSLLPLGLRKQIWTLMLSRRKLSGKVRQALEQNARPFGKPGVLNDRLAGLIDTDEVVVRPAIDRFDDNRAVFSDGSKTECDLVVCATGYEVADPFFSREILETNESFTHRYLRVIPPRQRGIFFVGRVSVVGSIFPILERQALWVADLLADASALPPAVVMSRFARRESKAGLALYADAGRHTDTVEFYPYLRALDKERVAGRARTSKMHQTAFSDTFAFKPENQLISE